MAYESGGYGKIGENKTKDGQVNVWCCRTTIVLNSTVVLALNALHTLNGDEDDNDDDVRQTRHS